MPSGKRPRIAVGLALFVLVCAVYLPACRNGFVNYDDSKTVYGSPEVVRGLSLDGVRWAFSHSVLGVWVPLTTLSHMLDCQFYGLRPWGHHFGNVVLHATTALLLFLLLSRTTEAVWRSAFAAAVFAVHPLRVESVAWVTERKDVLSGLFFLLTLSAYSRYAAKPSLRRYLLVLLVFALGLLAKSMLVTLPFVLLLVDYWPLRRWTPKADREDQPGSPITVRLTTLCIEKIPLLLVSIAFAIVQIIVARDVIQPLDRLSVSARLGNALVSCATYLGQMFWPLHLAAYYPHPGNSLPLWEVCLAFSLVAGISIAVVIRRREQPYLITGWFWYLAMLVPVIGIVQSGLLAHADRYTYLSQIGICIAITWTAAGFGAHWPKPRLVLAGCAALILASCIGLTLRQTATWADTETLFRHAVGATGTNPLARLNLGIALWEKGSHAEGLQEVEEAVREKPDYGEAHLNLGSMLGRVGRAPEALAEFQCATQIMPKSPEAHASIALLLDSVGRPQGAAQEFQIALELQPDLASRYSDLGIVLEKCGRFDEAMKIYREASVRFPGSPGSRLDLGAALLKAGRLDEASAEFRKVLRLDPSRAAAQNGLGSVLFLQGRLDEAKAAYERALLLQPQYPEARQNLEGLRQTRRNSPP